MIDIIFVLLIGICLITFVTFYINYNKYKKIVSEKDKTGYDSALEVTKKYNIDSYIIEKRGNFTDNYSYNNKAIKLSSIVFHDNNVYSVAMGYFISLQAVLDKEKSTLYRLKKLFEPLFYIAVAASYLSIILLAMNAIDIIYPICLLAFCLIYQLIFLKINLDIISRIKKEFVKKDDNLINALDALYLIDISFGVLYIRVLIDKIIDVIKNR